MKRKLYLLTLVLILSLSGSVAYSKDKTPEKALTEQQQQRIAQIESRVLEIKGMDRSHLSREERKDLRKELTSLKKEMKATNGGVYLSVGAIIIIILLLILLLG